MVYRKKIAESIQVWKAEILKNGLASDRILTLLYLANDVVQTSRKKLPEFPQQWRAIFREVIPLIAPRMSHREIEKAKRTFGIWADRKVYDASFCNDLVRLMDQAKGSSSKGSSHKSSSSRGENSSSSSSTRSNSTAPPPNQDDAALQKMPLFSQLRQRLLALSKLPYQAKNQDKYEDEHQSRIQSLLTRGGEHTQELKKHVPTLENIIDSYKDELKKKDDLIRFLDKERQNIEDQISVVQSLYLPRWEQLLEQVNETVDRKRKYQSFDEDYRDPRAQKRQRPNAHRGDPRLQQDNTPSNQPHMSSAILNQPPPDLGDIDALLGSLAELGQK